MNNAPDLEWAKEHIPGFRRLNEQVREKEKSEEEYRLKYAGCPKVAPKDQRRAA